LQKSLSKIKLFAPFLRRKIARKLTVFKRYFFVKIHLIFRAKITAKNALKTPLFFARFFIGNSRYFSALAKPAKALCYKEYRHCFFVKNTH